MSILLTADELALFAAIPEIDLVNLAIDLDIAVGEEIVRAELLGQAIASLAELARREGLPLSEYDLDDLEALEVAHRQALAQVLGTDASPAALIRSGKRVYKRYQKHNPKSQVPLMLPLLLPTLARCLANGEV